MKSDGEYVLSLTGIDGIASIKHTIMEMRRDSRASYAAAEKNSEGMA